MADHVGDWMLCGVSGGFRWELLGYTDLTNNPAGRIYNRADLPTGGWGWGFPQGKRLNVLTSLEVGGSPKNGELPKLG